MMMELSCESVRFPEDRRPASCKFVELHVLYVPDDQWDVKLNKVPTDAIESFISAGFIRVYPDVTLKTLRSNLGSLLGADRSIDKFIFLKCVGRSLALVKRKQEKDLKVKTFAPPYAPQPELYLLPTVENNSSVCSQSLTPDTSSSSPDHETYYPPIKNCNPPIGTKESIKFPLIPQCSHQPPPTHSHEEEEDDEEDEEQCFSSSEVEGENEDEGLSSEKLEWAEQECCARQPHNPRGPQSVSQDKGKTKVSTALQRQEADSAQMQEFPEDEETCRKKKQHHRQKRAVRDSGIAPSLEDRDSGFSLTERLGKSKDAPKAIRSNPTSEVTESPLALRQPMRGNSPPPDLHFVAATQKTVTSFVVHANRDELIEEIKLARAQRKQLEWKRQDLLRKGKDLLSLNRHRRNQARDSWKKKYFETKKATAPLEENLRIFQQELEKFYNKLLHQLQARENRGKPRRQGRSSIKYMNLTDRDYESQNELIIQIMTERYEIDNLKRKIEDAKMKLVIEIKLRKQAATELRALKAELAQKKSQLSHPGPTASLVIGNRTQGRPPRQDSAD